MRASGGVPHRLLAGIVVGASVAAGTVLVGAASLTLVLTRRVVTPVRRRRGDTRVRAVDHDGEGAIVTLEPGADARLRGRYGFLFDEGRSRANLGDVLSDDERGIRRRITAVDGGELRAGALGWFTGVLNADPAGEGLPFEEVAVPGPEGDLPAWFVPAEGGDDTGAWAIHVHGRGVQRRETLRGVPPFRAAGVPSLVVSWRNDGEAPTADSGRYTLGEREWADVDAAVGWALEHGASAVILIGWSMGGQIVLQETLRGVHRGAVIGLMLESPVIAWREVLEAQAAEAHVPAVVRRLAYAVLRSRLSWVSGQRVAIRLDELDLVARADELRVPVLLLHSDEDGFVPSGASRALAARRPDLVTFVPFPGARHVKLWNLDPDAWTAAVSTWLAALLDAQRAG